MKKNSDTHTVVIIPALNEEKGIYLVLKEIHETLENPYCIVIDGMSTDATKKIAEQMGSRVIVQKEKGKGAAFNLALRSLESDPKYVVLVDADFTYPIRYVKEMIELLERNSDVGMVLGDRTKSKIWSKSSKDKILYFGNKLIALVNYLVTGVRLADPLTGLRVIRWKILQNWTPKAKGFDIEVELNMHVNKKGYKILEVPINYRSRVGEKKLKMRHGCIILKRLLMGI